MKALVGSGFPAPGIVSLRGLRPASVATGVRCDPAMIDAIESQRGPETCTLVARAAASQTFSTHRVANATAVESLNFPLASVVPFPACASVTGGPPRPGAESTLPPGV